MLSLKVFFSNLQGNFDKKNALFRMNANRSPQNAGSSSVVKEPKIECFYGESCYSKRPEHFQRYTHPHLLQLLEEIDDDKIVIPSHYKSKISNKTLVEQLECVRKVTGCWRKYTSQESPSKGASSCSQSSGNKAEKSPVKEYLNPDWNSAMEHYRRDAMSRMKHSMKDKMEAASPYNIFLTIIKDSKETHNELLSISFPELLDPYFGELECSLQLNCLIEFEFVLAQYSITGNKSKPLTLLYTQIDCDLGNKFNHFITHEKVRTPTSFGSHHTKMMIFKYTNKSVRIVISTANLLESDWNNTTQGLWISPECPVLPENSSFGQGDSVTHFKQDLINYLTAYKLSSLEPWIGTLQQVDMSAVKVFFVGSTPGSFPGDGRNKRGLLKLSQVLKKEVAPNNGQVIAQCSSIGSLGPKPNSWLQGDVLRTLSSCQSDGTLESPLPLKLIYPTFNCISGSYDGLRGGGCLPYSRNTHDKQEWLVSYLHDWCSNKRHRTRAQPHIKSYTRVSEDQKRIYYFVLTSANMSKAAWGKKKSGGIYITSFEAGIVLIPRILISKDYFPLTDEGNGVKPFSLPYDLPLVPYSNSDVPWFIDNLS